MTLISPRDSEVQAVIALMESTEFETPEALARAIVVSVAGELAHRTTTGVAIGFPGEKASLAAGPFYDSRDVASFREKAQEAGLWTFTARLSSPDCIKDADALEAGFCECGHVKEIHVVKVQKGIPGPPKECGITECDCRSFTKRKAA